MSVTVKKELLEACYAHVDSRIENAQSAMKDIQEAANQEMKSSTGDKYETSRAMMHLEKDKLATHLQDAQKLKEILSRINAETNHQTAHLGSLVKTDKGDFFIAISIGRLKVGKGDYFVVSPASPIGKAMMDCRPGDKVTFNNQHYKIKEVL